MNPKYHEVQPWGARYVVGQYICSVTQAKLQLARGVTNKGLYILDIQDLFMTGVGRSLKDLLLDLGLLGVLFIFFLI